MNSFLWNFFYKLISISTSSKVLAACIASLFGILATLKTDTISKWLSYIRINGNTATFVIDTFWSDRYVDKKFVEKNSFIVQNYMGEVTLAGTSIKMPNTG